MADLRVDADFPGPPDDGDDDAAATDARGHAATRGSDTAAPRDADAAATRRSDAARRERAFWAELPVLVVVALVLALLLKTFVVQAFYIPSSSMEPTLQVQDRVLVSKLTLLYREPRRGEVVVFRDDPDEVLGGPEENLVQRTVGALVSGLGFGESSERDYIKRVIGLPGETLEMRGGVIYIDGEPLPESATEDGGYLSRPDLNDFGPVDIEPDHYFMMGDNRPNSSDSRFGLGQIPREDILGRAFVTIWPLDNFGGLPIADYDR